MSSTEPWEPSHRKTLARLAAAHPLPPGWKLADCFLQRAEIAGETMHLVGLVSEGPANAQATGSAAAPATAPIDRAYFELLERSCLLAAMAAGRARLPLLDAAGRARGSCAHDDAFPSAPPGASWAYARSNGVAAGMTFSSACRAAELELVERDRVLRSWYGQATPRRLAGPPLPRRFEAPRGAAGPHRYQTYEFVADRGPGPAVVGVFGFPRVDGAPLVYGFGAGEMVAAALSHAARECRQRLGFLWGEPLPDTAPAVAATAAFHQEYYLWSGAHRHLRAWLAGDHACQQRLLAPARPIRQFRGPERLFIDLTLHAHSPGVHVVKALPVDEVPLVFGEGHPLAPGFPSEPLAPHPIV